MSTIDRLLFNYTPYADSVLLGDFNTYYSTEPPNWDNYEPGDWTWPDLSEIELNKTCSAKIKGTTPGSDNITQVIITKTYQAIPDHFLQLY
jgi:hypothetical protein